MNACCIIQRSRSSVKFQRFRRRISSGRRVQSPCGRARRMIPPARCFCGRIQFPSIAAADKVGIDIGLVDRGPVVESVTATGEVIYDPTLVARLASRAGGTVWRVERNVGGHVQQGEVLALVDAAEFAAARLDDAGERLETTLPVAGSTSGITPLVQDVLLHVERWHTEQHVDHIVVFYCEHLSRSACRPQRLDLLPIDRRWLQTMEREKWPTHILPMFTMDADRLFSALVRQCLFVSLYRASAELLASENASRLAAMRGAERSIGDKIGEFAGLFHQQRQMTITEELLDIAAGFEALSGGDD